MLKMEHGVFLFVSDFKYNRINNINIVQFLLASVFPFTLTQQRTVHTLKLPLTFHGSYFTTKFKSISMST